MDDLGVLVPLWLRKPPWICILMYLSVSLPYDIHCNLPKNLGERSPVRMLLWDQPLRWCSQESNGLPLQAMATSHSNPVMILLSKIPSWNPNDSLILIPWSHESDRFFAHWPPSVSCANSGCELRWTWSTTKRMVFKAYREWDVSITVFKRWFGFRWPIHSMSTWYLDVFSNYMTCKPTEIR